MEFKLNMAKTGHVSGISFKYENIAFKGSRLGKLYSWPGLLNAGLQYDEKQDKNKYHEYEQLVQIRTSRPLIAKDSNNLKDKKMKKLNRNALMQKSQKAMAITRKEAKPIKKQIEELQNLQTGNIEALAAQIEPLAQAMASLSEDTRRTMIRIQQKNIEQQKNLTKKMKETIGLWRKSLPDLSEVERQVKNSAAQINFAVVDLKKSSTRISIKIFLLLIMTSFITGIAAGTGSWLYLKSHYISTKAHQIWPQETAEIVIKRMTE